MIKIWDELLDVNWIEEANIFWFWMTGVPFWGIPGLNPESCKIGERVGLAFKPPHHYCHHVSEISERALHILNSATETDECWRSWLSILVQDLIQIGLQKKWGAFLGAIVELPVISERRQTQWPCKYEWWYMTSNVDPSLTKVRESRETTILFKLFSCCFDPNHWIFFINKVTT